MYCSILINTYQNYKKIIHLIFYDNLFYINNCLKLLTVDQMLAVLNFQPSCFPFLTVEKICLVMNRVKCAVVDDKCAVLNGTCAKCQFSGVFKKINLCIIFGGYLPPARLIKNVSITMISTSFLTIQIGKTYNIIDIMLGTIKVFDIMNILSTYKRKKNNNNNVNADTIFYLNDPITFTVVEK